MIIGVPKEIKNNEYRVGLLPVGVEMLKLSGHKIYIEGGAGLGSGIEDQDYINSGAILLNTAEEIYENAEMVIKIKEPQPQEYDYLKKGQVLFTFFHFAASLELTEAMLEKETIAFAYETLQLENGELPCLTPMSEVAGRMSIHEGAKYLEEPMKGRGILLGGVPGVSPAEVVILGAGVVGSNACKMAAGLGAHVTILDINLNRLRYLDEIMPPNAHTLMSNLYMVREAVLKADLVISCVLIRGAKPPCLIDRRMVSQMKTGSVIIDVAIDQGGSVETSKPTTHDDPTFVVDGIVHYCVTNMPSAVARTSTYALTNATLPYILLLANHGYEQAIKRFYPLKRALNMMKGDVVLKEVADTFHLSYKKISFQRKNMVHEIIKERRSSLRTKRVLSIEHRCVSSQRKNLEKSWYLSTTEDISFGGLTFYTDYEYRPGDVLELRVVMSGLLDIFKGLAKVVRIEKKEMASYFLVAVNFQEKKTRSKNIKTDEFRRKMKVKSKQRL